MLTRNPKITAAGLALFTNQAPGFSVAITAIALGTGVYAPTGAETALQAEFARFPISSGTIITPSQIQIGALVTNTDATARSTSNHYVGEIGFYVGATLFAVLSQAGAALFYKSPDLDVPISYILDFSTLPPGSLTISVPAMSESLVLAAQTANAAALSAQGALTTIKASYYGPLAAAPATRPDGTARVKGDRYFDSVANAEKTFNGSIWYIPNIDSAALAGPGGAGSVGSATVYVAAITAVNAAALALADGAIVIAKGRDTANDGGGGVFIYSSSSVQTVDGGTVFAPSVGTGRLFREGWTVLGFAGQFDVKWFGVKADSATVDGTALQAAHDALVAVGRKGELTIPSNSTLKLNATFTLNISVVHLRGQNVKLDFTGLATGTAVKVVGRGTGAPYSQSGGGATAIEIVGAGKASSTIGLEFDTAAEAGASHSNFFGLNVHDFGTNLSFKRNTYAINFWGCDFYNSVTAANMPTGYANYGERISFFGCTIFNNDFAVVNNNPDGAFHFIGCSLDYNGVQAVAQAGRIFLDNCHIEAGNYASPPFVTYPVNGAAIIINGGWMLCTGSNTSDIFLSQTTARQGGGITVQNVWTNNMGTGRWKSGVGKFTFINPVSFNTTNNPKLCSQAENRLVDGGFENATVIDALIIADTAAITSRTAGANINLTTSSAYSRSGSKSLKVAKTYGGGSACQFMIESIPLSRVGALCHFLGYYKKPGTGTGTVYISFGYAKMQVNAGVELPVKTLDTGSTTVNFSAAAVDWTAVQSGEPATSAPAWATHFYVAGNLDSFAGPDSLYFDDFEFYEY